MVRSGRRDQRHEGPRADDSGSHGDAVSMARFTSFDQEALMRTFSTVLVVLCFCATAPAAALAQATGSIAGIVTDESGAVLPGVAVEAINVATNQIRSARTGADGHYSLPVIDPGQHTVTATLSGFKLGQRTGVVVNVESTARVDLKLAVGGVEESLTVAATISLVETSKATLGLVVSQKEVVEMPLNGRNFTQLGTLLPGVIAPPAGLGGSGGDATPGGFGAATSGFSVNGMRNQSNNFLLDGASNNDTFNTGFVLRPPPDAIQEFKILTHSYAAEYGRNAGSVVNVVTRSGGNAVHGAGWEFNRDDALQARNYFAPSTQPKPKLTQHQFGGTLGGPIARDRLFGFGYYEGHRNTTGITQNLVVLSDAERRGTFNTAIRDPRTGLPFPNNTIPDARIDPAARQLIERFVPVANSGSNRYIASPDTTDDRDQFGTRIDYRVTANNSLLGRYIHSRTHSVQPAITRPIGTDARAALQDVMVSDTHVFASNRINQARVSYNRIGARPQATSGLSNAAFGISLPHNVPSAQGLANVEIIELFAGTPGIGGTGGLGDVQQPFVERLNETLQLADDFTWVHGGHSMKFGAEVQRQHMFIAFVNRPNGDFTFNGVHTGNAAADFLLGLPFRFRRTTANTSQDGHGWIYGGYVQDEFRPRADLTVSAGLRYEVSVPFVDKNGALNSFRPGQQSTRFPQAPRGLVYPGDEGVPDGTYETDKNNLAPRLGFTWDPTGSGRATLRGAWGIFYDTLAGQGDFFQNGVLAPPFTPLVEVTAPPAQLSLQNPLSAVAGGATLFPPGLTFIGWGEDFEQPSAQHFNLTWSQEIGRHFAAETGYVGSRGRNLPIFIEVNPGLYSPGQRSGGARLYPAFSLVRPTFSVGKSWYDSLQTSFRMRPTRGMSFLAAYTLGHAVDHVSGLNIGGEQRPVLPVTMGDDASIERALELEKGDALFDARHRFVISFSAELPTPASRSAIVNHAFGGWQVNGIVQAQTGFPFTVIDPVQTIRYLTNRPNVTCDPNQDAAHSVDQWFNTACFVRRPVPDTAEPGNQERNTVRGPGFARTDLSVFKNVGVWRDHRLQFRVEMFNLFDQTRFGQPGNTIGSSTFGRITTSDDGRIVQLAVKYTF
ncbi:MAG: TonB-dependent receptor plug domain-containing protein [Luteitalea sp.]|nr:TonB-dependent receptor plug domain-containing protein [Luteitalea sp.]